MELSRQVEETLQDFAACANHQAEWKLSCADCQSRMTLARTVYEFFVAFALQTTVNRGS